MEVQKTNKQKGVRWISIFRRGRREFFLS